MNDMPHHPARKHPVHGVKLVMSSPTVIFLTVCTRNRLPWLATRENHQRLIAAWHDAGAWEVGRYVVMPDHMHLFCTPGGEGFALEAWVKYWKSTFTRSHIESSWRWQVDHWDTRMRSVNQYEEKWEYVRHNPVRAGLVERAEDWPYAGELVPLIW